MRDYQGLSETNRDYQRLLETMRDYKRLKKTMYLYISFYFLYLVLTTPRQCLISTCCYKKKIFTPLHNKCAIVYEGTGYLRGTMKDVREFCDSHL